MEEIIFEIKLKAIEPINGYKVGETVIIINQIFDRNVGIAFFPIDKNFDVIYKRQFIGLSDRNGKKIFNGDIVSDDEHEYVVGWSTELASFCLDRKGWMYRHWFGESLDPLKVEVVGNIYDVSDLK